MRRFVVNVIAATALCTLALGASSAAAAAPAISGVAFSSIRTDSVTLEAKINPNGKAAKYHFEYGSGDCEANPCAAIPAPDVALPLPPGSSPEPVNAEIEGLTPGTKYHFRVVAKSTGVGGGETKSPDATFTTYHPAPVFGPCPNDAFRVDQPSAKLPDCRAYEQASPVEKNGGDARGMASYMRASLSGDRISFLGTTYLLGDGGGQELPVYLSSRGGTGWSTAGILPPAALGERGFVIGWTPDYSQVFDIATRFSGAGGTTLLSRSSADGSIATIVPYGAGLDTVPRYAGASADGSQVVFEARAKLTAIPAALEGKSNVYLWDRNSGETVLAGVFNDGTAPPGGAIAGPYDWAGSSLFYYNTRDTHAISADGSVYFTDAGTRQLYQRRNPTKAQSPLNGEGECTDPGLACTIQLSASRKTNGTGPEGRDSAGTTAAAFMAATPDGSTAFFTSHEKLTNDANTGPEPIGTPAIARSGIGGGPGPDLSFFPTHAAGVAIDSDHLYWANPEAGTIGRAKQNGSGGLSEVDENFIVGAGTPQYVTVAGEYVYWTNTGDEYDEVGVVDGTSTIGRAKLDGSEPPKLDFITGASNPLGIDVYAEHIYWVNEGRSIGNGGDHCPGCLHSTRDIGRADLGGGNVNQHFIEITASLPHAVAVDASHIYVTESAYSNEGPEGFESAIKRYGLDGNEERQIFSGVGVEPRGIAVDDGHVYWAAEGKDAIGRANLDLEEVELSFIPGAAQPHGLAIDSEHLFWSAYQKVPPNPGNDLYRYDVDSEQLTDLTPDSVDQNGAEVQGVLGSSDDGSYVYFVANADLDGTGPATSGDCRGSSDGFGSPSFFGECNVYLLHEGTFTSIARLTAGGPRLDLYNWRPFGAFSSGKEKSSRVSPDGRTLLFSEGSELYRYRVGDGAPSCVSCNPSEAPTGGNTGFGSINLSFLRHEESHFVLSRNLSADGNRVFFETTDPLVAADVNGEGDCPMAGPAQGHYPICLDVYEWEAKGTGSCEEDVQGGGCLYLLSTGDSPDASYIADASASGDDVFFVTRSQLVGQDNDELYDVYDASVGGGLASQNEAASVPCEGAEACRKGLSTAPESQSPGTQTFAGPPNLKAKKPRTRCPKAKRAVRAKGKTRCVAKKQHKRNTDTKRRTSR